MLFIAWLMQVPSFVILLLTLVGIFSAMISRFIVMRLLSRLVEQLTLGVRQITAGEFKPIILPHLPRDFALLVESLNQMIASLHKRDEQLQSLNDELSRRVRELDALYEVSRSVNSSLDRQQVLRTILNETVRTFPTARKGLIHLLDESGKKLIPIALSDRTTKGFPLREKSAGGMSINKGIAGRVVRERRPIILSDTSLDPDFIDLGSDVRSLMVTPLEIGDSVIGVLSLDSEQHHAFTADMMAVFRSLANRAAIALENARLYGQSQQRVAELSKLYQITMALSSTHRRELLYERLVQNAIELLNAKGGVLFLSDREKQSLKMTCRINIPVDAVPKYLSFGQGLVAQFAQGSQTALPLTKNSTEQEENIIAAPIIWENQVLGLIKIWAYPTKNHFNTAHTQLLTLFAQQAANALENARLLESQRHRSRQLALLNKLNRRLVAIIDIETLLEEAIKSIKEGFAYSVVSIGLIKDGWMVMHGALTLRLKVYSPYNTSLLMGQEGIISHVAATGQPYLVNDITTEPYFSNLESNLSAQSELALPIIGQEGVLGVLDLQEKELNAFHDNDVTLLQSFAMQLGSVLDNVRLIEELQSKTVALELANQDLMLASQLKSQFLANMSHELRTPLNAIIGFSEILLDQLFAPLNPRQNEYLNNINLSGQHLLALINDILDLSKIEAGRMELKVHSFRLAEAVAEVCAVIEPLTAKKELTLSVVKPNTPTDIIADRLRFKQVLYNLLSNAVKFTPKGGRIDIRIWEQSARDDKTYSTLYLSVEDTGIGIPEEQQAEIFDSFHRVDSSYARQTEGTGLGLALVQRFIELHGGDVKVESILGEGSTFTISLPQKK
jgi:signal transduction histidine kinase